MAETHLALSTRGYHDPLIGAGCRRAWGTAEQMTRPLSESIRGQAFCELLAWELAKVEDWVRRTSNGYAR